MFCLIEAIFCSLAPTRLVKSFNLSFSVDNSLDKFVNLSSSSCLFAFALFSSSCFVSSNWDLTFSMACWRSVISFWSDSSKSEAFTSKLLIKPMIRSASSIKPTAVFASSLMFDSFVSTRFVKSSNLSFSVFKSLRNPFNVSSNASLLAVASPSSCFFASSNWVFSSWIACFLSSISFWIDVSKSEAFVSNSPTRSVNSFASFSIFLMFCLIEAMSCSFFSIRPMASFNLPFSVSNSLRNPLIDSCNACSFVSTVLASSPTLLSVALIASSRRSVSVCNSPSCFSCSASLFWMSVMLDWASWITVSFDPTRPSNTSICLFASAKSDFNVSILFFMFSKLGSGFIPTRTTLSTFSRVISVVWLSSSLTNSPFLKTSGVLVVRSPTTPSVSTTCIPTYNVSSLVVWTSYGMIST